MSIATYQTTIVRDVGHSERTADGRGVKWVKTGEEECTCELTVDLQALAALLAWKIRRSSKCDKTTLADGAIVLKVNRKLPLAWEPKPEGGAA